MIAIDLKPDVWFCVILLLPLHNQKSFFMRPLKLFRLNLRAMLNAEFLSGIASAFGFVAYPSYRDGIADDINEIKGDWVAVGNYLKDVYENR